MNAKLSSWEPCIAAWARTVAISVAMTTIALVIGWALTGCSMSTAKRISVANESARALRQVVQPVVDGQCLAMAQQCKAKGISTVEACDPLVTCRKVRDAFYRAVNGVHAAAATAAVLSTLGRDSGLSALLKTCLEFLAKAHGVAMAAGWIGGSK